MQCKSQIELVFVSVAVPIMLSTLSTLPSVYNECALLLAATQIITFAAHRVCLQVVQDAVQGAVQDAVQQVMDDTRVKFDVRANFYTLIAITGVVIFW